jgi:hypothetical protein
MNLNTIVPIWVRILDTSQDALSPEVARYLLQLHFPEADHERMRALLDRAKAGTQTEEERAENEEYIRAGHLLALLKAKARIALRKAGFPMENGVAVDGQVS